MSNNNQGSRNNYQPNPNYQSRRPYAQPQPNNHPNQTNQPANHHYYSPNQRHPSPHHPDLSRPYPRNYYYPYPYPNFNSYPPQPFAPPMYIQQPMYSQQMPNNMQHLGYNRQMPQYPPKQCQFHPNASQIKKNQDINQGINFKNYTTPNKRPYNQKANSDYTKQAEKQSPYNKTPEKKQENYDEDQQEQQIDINLYESDSESEEEQEQVYYKRKAIIKKKDPILDNREQIRKWVEARRRNYPRKDVTKEQRQKRDQKEELSVLQKKIRKKICLINADPKSVLKKQKDLDILRRFMLYPRRPRKQPKYFYQKRQSGPLVQQIAEHTKDKLAEPILQAQAQKLLPEQQEMAEKELIKQPEENNLQEALEVPIKSEADIVPMEKETKNYEGYRNRREDLSVDVIIKHLQMKQREDTKVLANLMDYKTNSFSYRYQHQTLQTNLLLENIFKDTSYMLQAIRHIVKNNFFE